MILSDKDVLGLMKEGKLSIDPFDKDELTLSGHVNLRLSPKLLQYQDKVLDLKAKEPAAVREIMMGDDGYILGPGEFLLGSTVERVSIPSDHFGFIETKGNIARAGIQAHNTDGHIDPGFSGTVTLEIKNNASHSIVIYPNIAFVQLYIFQLSSEAAHSYSGKYQNQMEATTYKAD